MISVVIPVRYAETTIEKTLADVLAGPADEVVLAVSSADPSCADVRRLAAGRVRAVERAGARSVPELRGAGWTATRGDVVAFTEDHCRLAEGWPRPLVDALEDGRVGAAGGPVRNGRTSTLRDRAIYAARYAAFAPPVRAGACPALPGTSILRQASPA